MPPSFTPWRPLAIAPAPRADGVLAEILDGGQAFRWHRQADGSWLGSWGECFAHVRLGAAGPEWRAPAAIADRVTREIGPYFGDDRDVAGAIDALPWRSDVHLARCLAAFPGLRLLRQPFGETLLAFLCSATKQIVQIKQMLALLAERHGSPLRWDGPAVPDQSAIGNRPSEILPRRLPTWAQLADIPEAELRGCLLGFRARYIHRIARFLAEHPGWLEETERLDYAAAKLRLCTLPGVGEKVADCVLLFGAGRLEAFPVDVWIVKTMATRYGLSGWKPSQIAHFGRTHFGPAAGLAQQYLFAFERRERRRPATGRA